MALFGRSRAFRVFARDFFLGRKKKYFAFEGKKCLKLTVILTLKTAKNELKNHDFFLIFC